MKQLFADMHCDTITALYDKVRWGSSETLIIEEIKLSEKVKLVK